MARLLQDSPSLPWRIIRHVIASLRLQSDSLRLVLILTCCPVKLGRTQSQCESFPMKSSSGSPANIRMSPCTVCLSAAHGGLNMTHGDFQKKKFLSFKTSEYDETSHGHALPDLVHGPFICPMYLWCTDSCSLVTQSISPVSSMLCHQFVLKGV